MLFCMTDTICSPNRLDVYIHDYLVKRDLKASAQAFQAEGKVSSDPVGVYLLKLNIEKGLFFFNSKIFFFSL